MRPLIIIFAILNILSPNLEEDFTCINEKLSSNWIEYDFGEIFIGERTECDLILKNTSSEKIHISCLIPGCHCLTIKANHKTIKPSKTLMIHIIYDTTNKQKGYDEQSIILCLEGSKNPICFVLKANLNDYLI